MRFRSVFAPALQASVLVASFACLLCPAFAQHGGGGGGGGMRGGGGRPGMSEVNRDNMGEFGRDRPSFGGNTADAPSPMSTARGGLQVGPAGRWWDDKHFAKQLQLRPEQQRHMDTVFETNRALLLKRFGDLQAEENRMEALTRAKTLDESALFAQIDRVAQARADLEKANTHFLLGIRGEMDPDQISRLDSHR